MSSILSAPKTQVSTPFLDSGQSVPGFGEYSIPENKTFEGWLSTQKAFRIALLCLFGVLIGCCSSLFFIPLAGIPALPPALIITGLVIITALSLKIVLECLALRKIAPPTNDLCLSTHPCPRPGKLSKNCEARVLPNSVASNKLKLELMKQAQSIFLCGNYCGGTLFQQALQIIKNKLTDGSLNEVYIISSDFFLTSQDRKILSELANTFPDQFSYVIYPELRPSLSPPCLDWRLSTIHPKALVTKRVDDQGKKIIEVVTGGDGIAPPWSKLPGEHPEKTLGSLPIQDDASVFIVSDEHGIGQTVYEQLLKLFFYKKYPEDQTIYSSKKTSPMKPLHKSAPAPAIQHSLPMASNVKCKLFPTGPEHASNSMLKELIKCIQKAEKTILISHFYFHLCDELLEALVEAAKRGVDIKIVSNGLASDSPITHYAFVDLNYYYFQKLLSKVTNGRIKIFEYKGRASLHTKMVILDDKLLIIGSHNFAYRSLKGLVDYELSLFLESKDLALQAKKSLEEHHFKNTHLYDPKSRSCFSQVKANLQHLVRGCI